MNTAKIPFAKPLLSALTGLILAAGALHAGPVEKRMSRLEARELVQPFYDLFEGKTTVKEAGANISPAWKSYYANGKEAYRGLDKTTAFIDGPLRKMIPDLQWRIKEVIVGDGNEIIVRGEATGTPAGGSLMGHPAAEGKSFTIMSIDIHKIENGKVVTTYHIEDWKRAMKQVAPKP